MAYKYAVIKSPGRYGCGKVKVDRLTNNRETAIKLAERWTRQHQAAMAPHGGTTGFYAAVEWGHAARYFWADMPPGMETYL